MDGRRDQADGRPRAEQRREEDRLLKVGDLRKRWLNGTTSRNANSTCTPGSATRSSPSSSWRLRSSRSASVSSRPVSGWFVPAANGYPAARGGYSADERPRARREPSGSRGARAELPRPGPRDGAAGASSLRCGAPPPGSPPGNGLRQRPGSAPRGTSPCAPPRAGFAGELGGVLVAHGVGERLDRRVARDLLVLLGELRLRVLRASPRARRCRGSRAAAPWRRTRPSTATACTAEAASATGPGTVSALPPSCLIRRSTLRACAFVSFRCCCRRFLYGALVVIPMCACSAVSSSFSLPYASFRYWISFRSRCLDPPCRLRYPSAMAEPDNRAGTTWPEWLGRRRLERHATRGPQQPRPGEPGFWHHNRPPLRSAASAWGSR